MRKNQLKTTNLRNKHLSKQVSPSLPPVSKFLSGRTPERILCERILSNIVKSQRAANSLIKTRTMKRSMTKDVHGIQSAFMSSSTDKKMCIYTSSFINTDFDVKVSEFLSNIKYIIKNYSHNVYVVSINADDLKIGFFTVPSFSEVSDIENKLGDLFYSSGVSDFSERSNITLELSLKDDKEDCSRANILESVERDSLKKYNKRTDILMNVIKELRVRKGTLGDNKETQQFIETIL